LSKDPFTILLCFSDTGKGHRSATQAIQAGLDEVIRSNPEAGDIRVITDTAAEHSHFVNRLLVCVYNLFLRYRQDWMKYYAGFIEWLKPNQSEFGYWLSGPYFRHLLLRTKPAVVVSVHPMLNHYLARAIKDLQLGPTTRLVVMVTDPCGYFWSGWACPDADLTIAPNDLARDRLLDLGLDPARIKIIGMPVGPQFSRPAVIDRKMFLSSLGLDPEKFTVCLTSGSEGGGHIVQIYSALAEVKRPMQVVVLCGNNKRLFRAIEKVRTQNPAPTIVMPYSHDMSDLMNACDLLVTKAGGLTTFEAVARRLPMALDLLTAAMPQEAGTAQLLIEAGLARPIEHAADIVSIVESQDGPADRSKKRLPKTHSLDRVDAVYQIADLLISEAA
jgi:UDP-N-acetylglucosamine:LPS N-acetylglucosamine transferase